MWRRFTRARRRDAATALIASVLTLASGGIVAASAATPQAPPRNEQAPTIWACEGRERPDRQPRHVERAAADHVRVPVDHVYRPDGELSPRRHGSPHTRRGSRTGDGGWSSTSRHGIATEPEPRRRRRA